MKLRNFDHLKEDPEKIFQLFEDVYCDSKAIRERWEWEFNRYPRAGQVRIYIAESWEGEVVGMTVRMPCDLKVGREVVPAFFATNSMVKPAFRGQGVIRNLYGLAAEDGALQLSKGTSPVMQRQLVKMGYQKIEPSNYQVCLLSPLRWAVGRFAHVMRSERGRKAAFPNFPDFTQVDRFTPEYECLAPLATVLVMKSADELNWRYIDPPHCRYSCYARRVDGQIVSWCVIRSHGQNAWLVDFRWIAQAKDEPRRTIQFAKTLSRSLGAVKLTGWATHSELYQGLKRAYFLRRKESPGFSFFSHEPRWRELCWELGHFVPGDGDTEYLLKA